jgi:type IV pilus assembly protein PilB
MDQQQKFLNIIVEREHILKAKLEAAEKEKKNSGELLFEVVIRLGILPREKATRYWAEATGYEYIDISRDDINPEAANIIPKSLAEKHTILPFDVNEEEISVAVYNVSDVLAIDMLRRTTNKEVKVVLASRERLTEAIRVFYGDEANLNQDIERNIAAAIRGSIARDEYEPPFVRLIDLFIKKAIVDQATDIHISPDEKATRVGYRVDGILRTVYVLPPKLLSGLVTRVKILSNLNIAEQRLPQGGAIRYEYAGRYIDIRTSTMPTANGENVVLRLLDKANIVLGLDSLGLEADDVARIVDLSLKPHGIILSAGPTGSGKTTTLYSILQQVNALERNVLTIEDPIEYRLAYIKQSQVNEKAGLHFATAIRTFLRQDPDVILVGEIRDLETAKIAFQAAMTGHLVLSTIHTNDAASCIARLMDLGVETYLIPSSLRAVMSQRLVRKVCPRCREEHIFDDEERKWFKIDELEKELGIQLRSQMRGAGCPFCGESGYKGRIAIFELLPITPTLSPLILRQVSSDQILLQAKAEGLRTMMEDGMRKVIAGKTTIEEIYRVTG